jgi:hypothetical protein
LIILNEKNNIKWQTKILNINQFTILFIISQIINKIQNNEERLIAIINKKSNNLKNTINLFFI